MNRTTRRTIDGVLRRTARRILTSPEDYLVGRKPHDADFAHDLSERCEYARLARANPLIGKRSKWLWGRQIRIATCPFSGRPMYLPAAALLNGILIEGRSGTRKSALLDSLIAQLIALAIGTKYLIISYKPSMSSFANAAIAAADAGIRFRHLSVVPGDHSYGLPLLHALWNRVANSLDTATLALMAMGQHHGISEYGKGYYTLSKVVALAHVMAAAALDAEGWTFRNLARHLATCDAPAGYEKEFENSRSELVNLNYVLGSCDVANCLPGDDRALIDPVKFFLSDRREVLYVQVSSNQKPTISALLPQLLTMIGAETLMSLPNTNEIRLVVVVDEAADWFFDYSADVVQQLRSKGVVFIFAYQHLGQFKKGKRDYSTDFEGYASTKIYLGVEDKERAELFRYFAGEEQRVTSVSYPVEYDPDPIGGDLSPIYFLSDEYHGTKMRDGVELVDRRASPRTATVGPRPRLSPNDVFSLFSREGYGLIRSSVDRELWRQSGLMVPAYFGFHISGDEYERREALEKFVAPGTLPVTFTDEFARYVREMAQRAPTITQGETWAKIKKNRRPDGP